MLGRQGPLQHVQGAVFMSHKNTPRTLPPALPPARAGDIEVYAAELADLLQKKAASVAALQQKVHHFRRLMAAALDKQGGF